MQSSVPMLIRFLSIDRLSIRQLCQEVPREMSEIEMRIEFTLEIQFRKEVQEQKSAEEECSTFSIRTQSCPVLSNLRYRV